MPARSAREGYRMVALAHETANSLVKRERAGVEKLARQHAKDGVAWVTGLQAFYNEHAEVIAKDLVLPVSVAREYVAKHGRELQRKGVAALEDMDFEAVQDLAILALTGGAAERAA
jgi:hypothetical protein